MRAIKFLSVLVAMGVLAAGCATGGGVSDEELVMASLTKFKEGLESEDLDMAMSAYAEDFTTGDGADKAGARAFFQNEADNGILETIEVNIEEVELMFEDGECIAEPVVLESDMGILELSITFKPVEDQWLIAYAEEF